MPRKTAAAGEAAIIGIRPSDIRLAAKGETAIASKIHLLEPLGDITSCRWRPAAKCCAWCCPRPRQRRIKVGDPAADHSLIQTISTSSAPQADRQ